MKILLLLFLIINHTDALAFQISTKQIKLQEKLTIGNEKGNLIFEVHSIGHLQDGSLIISDKLDYKLKKINKFGKIVLQVGKRGKNPGEFTQGPSQIDVYKNIVAVAEFSSRRVHIFSDNLEYKSSFYAPDIVFRLKFDRDGNIWLGVVSYYRKNQNLVKVDRKGTVLKSIKLKNSRNVKEIGNEIWNFFDFAINPTNGDIIVAYNFRNKIEIWDSAGNFKSEFTIPGIPESRKKIISTGGLFGKKIEVPEDLVFSSLWVNGEGYIFILIGDVASSPKRDVFVLNDKGEVITSFKLPQQSSWISLDQDGYLYTIENQRTIIKKYRMIYHGR